MNIINKAEKNEVVAAATPMTDTEIAEANEALENEHGENDPDEEEDRDSEDDPLSYKTVKNRLLY